MINAQEAYQNSVKQLDILDVSDILADAEFLINDSIKNGYLGTQLCVRADIPDFKPNPESYSNVLKIEKAAIELNKLGYAASTIATQPMAIDGKVTPLFGIRLDWKYIPLSTRESYD